MNIVHPMKLIDDRPLGTVFPPRSLDEMDAYDDSELMEGFLSYEREDPEPGGNRSAAFRWAWACRRADATKVEDGFYPIRRAYARRLRERQGGSA